jgi:hypothetical protein
MSDNKYKATVRLGRGHSGDPDLEEPAVVMGDNVLLFTSLTGVDYPCLTTRGKNNECPAPWRQFAPKNYVD